jgi:hypothetical protein
LQARNENGALKNARVSEVIAMKSARALGAAILAAASLSPMAQQPATSTVLAVAQKASSSAPTPPTPTTPSAVPAAPMSPIAGELMNMLDSKTAKVGDRIVLKTKSAVRTAEGTEIPKGSKLIGRVVAAKASTATDANAQVALQFDQIEFKDGQTLPIQSEIQALSPAANDASTAESDSGASSPSPSSAGRSAGDMYGSSPSPMANTRIRNGGAAPATPGSAPPAGTLVGRTGGIAIRTTSIPGVLLAVREPGPQDAQMARSSGILLGVRRDIHLDEGTKVVIGVAAGGATTDDK